MNGQEKPSLDDLAHFGVKGMHWGQHSTSPTGSAPSNRQLNKASKAKDKAARNAEIDAARTRYSTTARKNYVKAKTQYKADKKTIGTREARKKFDAVKQKNIDDYDIGAQAKSGVETTAKVLAVVGVVTVATVLKHLALANS